MLIYCGRACVEASGLLSIPQVEGVHGLERQRPVQEGPEREEIPRGESLLPQSGECVHTLHHTTTFLPAVARGRYNYGQ